jgi:VanZ family protein
MESTGHLASHTVLTRFAPPLALMALIFFFSAQPHLATDLGTVDLIGRKLVHMLEYGLLWLLWWRAFDRERPGLAAAITFLYAASDEYHQTFVDGRNGSPLDVAIDMAGMTVAIVLARRRERRRSAYSQPRSVA